jgi:hypothetical protein
MLTAHVSSTPASFTQGLDCSFFSGWFPLVIRVSPTLPGLAFCLDAHGYGKRFMVRADENPDEVRGNCQR